MERIGGRYEIRGTLGKGGTADVLRAYDAVEGREVALKCLDAECANDPTVRLLFQDEFRRLSQVVHPNFPAAYDIGSLDERPYFAMELVTGTPLNKLAKIDLPKLYAIVGQLLQALSFLHARGFVHRDVKPGNIIVRDDGRVTLMDLGLLTPIGARAEEELRGTPAYMSPEVIRGGVITEAADIYSLGVLCYERLTGHKPFGGTDTEVLAAHLYDTVPPLRLVAPHLPDRLVTMVHRMLAKNPADRYGSAGDVARDLSELVGHVVLVETGEQKAGYVASDHLVGREREWTRLRDAVLALKEGAGKAVFLDGAAGVGKSRLLREARLESKLARHVVAATTAPERIGEPFAIIAQLVEATLVGRPDEEVVRHASALAGILPALRATLPEGAAPASSGSPEQIARALVEWCRHITATRPLVVVVDDLQWADQLSVDVLNRTIRRLRDRPVLFLGGYRGEEIHTGHPVTHTIEEGLTERIELEPFRAPQVRELLSSMLSTPDIPEAFASGVHRATGGNAFFVNEFLRYLMDEDYVTRRGGSFSLPEHLDDAATPSGLARTVSRRLGYLEPSARALLEVAAVWGDTIHLAHWFQLSGQKPEAFLAAVQELTSRLFVERRSEDFSFVHARARDIVLESIEKDRLRLLSRSAGELLEKQARVRRNDVVPRLAVYFADAGDCERGIRYSLEAGESALAKSAESEAFAHLKRAEALLAASPEGAERDAQLLGIYERVAQLSSAVWIDAPTCLEWFRKAVEQHARMGNLEKVFGLSLSRAITLTIAGHYRDARGVLAEFARGVAPGTMGWAVLYGVGVCLTDWYEGHQRACLEHATEAIRIFEANLGDASPDGDFAPYSWALFWREKARSYLGLPIDMENIAKIRAMADCGRSDPIVVWHTMTSVGARACFTGRMTDLLDWKTWAEEASRAVGKIFWFECWVSHSYVYGMLGAFRLDALGEHVSRLFKSPDPYQQRLGHLFKGRLALAYGHYDDGARSLETFLEEEEKHGPDNSLLEGLIHLTFCRLGQQRLGDAALLIECGLGLATSAPLGTPIAELQFRRLAAELALANSDADVARASLERALAIAEETDNPVQRGWVHLALARCAAAEERRDAMTSHFAEARRAFASIENEGALQNVAATEARLTRADCMSDPLSGPDDVTLTVSVVQSQRRPIVDDAEPEETRTNKVAR